MGIGSIWYWVTHSGASLGYLTEWQLRERHYDLLDASQRSELERASCVVGHARVETAADRGHARDALRAKILPFPRETES